MTAITAIKVQKIEFPTFTCILTEPLIIAGLHNEHFSLKILEGYIPTRIILPYTSTRFLSCLTFFSKTGQQTILASNLATEVLNTLRVPFDQGIWLYEVPFQEVDLSLSFDHRVKVRFPEDDLITKYMY